MSISTNKEEFQQSLSPSERLTLVDEREKNQLVTDKQSANMGWEKSSNSIAY